MAKRRAVQTTLSVLRTEDVPLMEVSGVCLRRERGNDMALVAFGDRTSLAAWVELPDDDEGAYVWETVDLADVKGSFIPREDPQVEAVCADGAGRILILQEWPPRLELLDWEGHRVVTRISLEIPADHPLYESWFDSEGSQGEGAAFMQNGHLLIAKEKDPAAFIEFGPAGDEPSGFDGDSALHGGARWPIEEGAHVFVPLAVWMPSEELLEGCADFSDLEVGPDRNLYLLSDKSQSIARVGAAGRRRGRRRRRRDLAAAHARRQARGPGVDAQRPGDRRARHQGRAREPRAAGPADRGGRRRKEMTDDGDPGRGGRDPAIHRPAPDARTRSGATPEAMGTNFAVFSQHATSVELLLFESHDSPQPVKTIQLDPTVNRTFYFWHVYVVGVTPGMGYAYRVDGPKDLHAGGHRFNPNKVLIDPYGRGTTSTLWDRVAACGPDDNVGTLPEQRRHRHDRLRLGRRPAAQPLDAGHGHLRDARPRLHQVADVGRDATPGTYLGVIEKIPYLKSLGVTAVELLPVFEFDEDEISGTNPLTGQQLINYWGYNPISFFAPHEGYCVAPDEGSHVREFRDMVKALHKAGIEVILDVVFNHTGEGNDEGPTISFKGLDNNVYYMLSPRQAVLQELLGLRQHGQLQPPAGREVHRRVPAVLGAQDARRRLPLRPGLDPSRGPDGAPDERSAGPLAHRARRRAGRHQDHRRGVGRRRPVPGRLLPGLPLGRVERPLPRRRPALRQGRRGPRRRGRRPASAAAPTSTRQTASCRSTASTSSPRTTASRSTTSSRTTASTTRPTAKTTATATTTSAGTTASKGDTDDAGGRGAARPPGPNFLAILMLSQGVPMMLMGDEVRQTQLGNNNAYCQDNEITWFDWTRAEEHADLRPLHRRAHRLPQGAADAPARPVLHRRRQRARAGRHLVARLPALLARLGRPLVAGPRLHPGRVPDAAGRPVHADRHRHPRDDEHGLRGPRLRRPDRRRPAWHRVIDTAAPGPHDIFSPGHEPAHEGDTYRVAGARIVVLISKA